jgi:hypothetical protein
MRYDYLKQRYPKIADELFTNLKKRVKREAKILSKYE